MLGVLGGLGHVGIAMCYLFALPLAGGEEAPTVAYVERLNASPAVGAVAFPLILCFSLGVLVMASAAWRAGLVGWWWPAALTAAVLAEAVFPAEIPAVQLRVIAVLVVVFGYLGLRVLRMTDTEWDGIPAASAQPVPAPRLLAAAELRADRRRKDGDLPDQARASHDI